jgi:hypothetical protein
MFVLRPAMENIDRFFEAYDRVIPNWFGDALAAVIVFGPILLFAL